MSIKKFNFLKTVNIRSAYILQSTRKVPSVPVLALFMSNMVSFRSIHIVFEFSYPISMERAETYLW